jgi:hypothetical protein
MLRRNANGSAWEVPLPECVPRRAEHTVAGGLTEPSSEPALGPCILVVAPFSGDVRAAIDVAGVFFQTGRRGLEFGLPADSGTECQLGPIVADPRFNSVEKKRPQGSVICRLPGKVTVPASK